jgi:hypothetical protein
MVERLEDDEAANAKLFGQKFAEFLEISETVHTEEAA